jgi:hypothetical protein
MSLSRRVALPPAVSLQGRILTLFIAVPLCARAAAGHAINIKTHTHTHTHTAKAIQSTLICATELVMGMTGDYQISAPRVRS